MPDRTRPIRKEICLNEQELNLIHLKITLTAREAAIQQHRHQQDRQYAESAQLPLRFVRRDEKACQTEEI